MRKDELALETCRVWNDGCSNWSVGRGEGLGLSGETGARNVWPRGHGGEVAWCMGRKEQEDRACSP